MRKATTAAVAALVLGVMTLFGTAPAAAAEGAHKVVIHVDENDPARMNMALNNAKNVRAYYDEKGESTMIEIVAYGPGLHMLRKDTSPVAQRISAMSMEMDNLTFSGCGNTHAAMTRKEGKEVELLGEATMVPSGVVRIMELQEQGYSYVRP